MAHNVEHFAEDGVRQGIEDLIASLTVYHDLAAAQDGEVLGEVGLLDAETGLEGAGGELAVAEDFDDGNAGGMGKSLEDGCLVGP
jgi:hypothetical protein